MSDTKSLKNCPFCKSKDSLQFFSEDNHLCLNGKWTIWCGNCEVEMTEDYVLEEKVKKVMDRDRAKKRIKKRWNSTV